MMGTRERLGSGWEWDAFSRRARRALGLSSRAIQYVKRRFWRRTRRKARLDIRRELA